MLWQTYPPGADIGFHTSVINSISHSGNTNFLWNSYQMGGEVELEFPGYHIFASYVISITGMTSYLAQGVIAAFFSSLVVLAAFLITRTVWTELSAFIVAFFVAFSRFDIEILSWGGYPNIIALLFIPLTFYMFLKRDKFTTAPFIVSTSILTASIFLTHSLSAAIFVAIAGVTFVAVLIFPKLFCASRRTILYLALPIFMGAILVSPFLASAAQPYLNDSATFIGSTAIEKALLATQTVPIVTVLALAACLVPFFLLSKKYKGRYFSLPVFLLIMWLLVPLLLTQGYLVGLYVQYIRFQYFLIMPVIILFGVMIDYAFGLFAKTTGASYSISGVFAKINLSSCLQFRRILRKMSPKTVQGAFLASIILILLFGLPIFLTPWEGIIVRNYYQVMDNAGYQGIEWAKKNTSDSSVFVSDAYYGWWLAGFGQRPTITAVNFQYLTVAREVNLSRNASYLLDTDYVIDNGYIQVREDGGYLSRHNPLFLADLNSTDSPFGFFQFNSSEITLLSNYGNIEQSTNLANLSVTSMQLDSINSDSASIDVNRANNALDYSEITTVTKGQIFANMTIIIQSNNPNVSLDGLSIILGSQGIFQPPFDNTLAMLDQPTKTCGQLIFVQNQPAITNYNLQNPCITQLSYNLQAKSKAEIQILVGIFPVLYTNIQNPMTRFLLTGALTANLQNPPTATDLPINTFDYKATLQEYNVSYIVNRDFELNGKYEADPEFSLAFINNEVAIFKFVGTPPPGDS